MKKIFTAPKIEINDLNPVSSIMEAAFISNESVKTAEFVVTGAQTGYKIWKGKTY